MAQRGRPRKTPIDQDQLDCPHCHNDIYESISGYWFYHPHKPKIFNLQCPRCGCALRADLLNKPAFNLAVAKPVL